MAILTQPELLIALDVAVLAMLTLAIIVGVRALRRLAALQAARAEWARELAVFSERADMTEASLGRLTDALAAEGRRRADPPTQAPARQAPAAEIAPSRPTASSILSMQ
jgi:hypothetical protein